MAENSGGTDDLSDMHYTLLTSSSESTHAGQCCKQATQQGKLHILTIMVVPTFLKLGRSVYWELRSEYRTEIGITY